MMWDELKRLTRLFAQKGTVILLESQSSEHEWSRKSYLAALPKAEIKARNDRITVLHDSGEEQFSGNPWRALVQFRNKYDSWVFGYLGYDLKNHIEELSSENTDQVQAPDMYFMVPGFLLEYDRKKGETKVLVGKKPAKSALPSASSGRKESFLLKNVAYQTSKATYLANIKEAQRRIVEGDFYEINLSHQLNGEFEGSAWRLYNSMKRVGPVPFGAYLQTDDWTVCCQSPERFLRKEGSTVFSQPIKGTSQRGADEKEDEFLKKQLASSAKEQAENLMIVDLVRNDLSRIAKPGSVKVSELFGLHSFGTVHQMVSTIMAEVRENDPVAILEACFPMGSMTGAPKISAMKSIEELEDYRRGIYSGAIGYIKPGGDFDFNVVIRSAIIQDNNLYYSIGGAITSDSSPEKEWEETEIKARALLEAVMDAQQI